jgi:hypothetical protein
LRCWYLQSGAEPPASYAPFLKDLTPDLLELFSLFIREKEKASLLSPLLLLFFHRNLHAFPQSWTVISTFHQYCRHMFTAGGGCKKDQASTYSKPRMQMFSKPELA